MAELAVAIVGACFFTGCAVRAWRYRNDMTARRSRFSIQDARLRMAVRTAATDAPGERNERSRPDDDPAIHVDGD